MIDIRDGGIAEALSRAKSDGNPIYIPAGTWRFDLPLVIDDVTGLTIVGDGPRSMLHYYGVGDALTLRRCRMVSLRNFALSGVGGVNGDGARDASGLALDTCDGVECADFVSQWHGRHGIEARGHTICLHLRSGVLQHNGGNGLNDYAEVNGYEGQANAWSVCGTTIRGNAGHGIDWCGAGLAIEGMATIEGNLGYGLLVDAITRKRHAYGLCVNGAYFESNKLGNQKIRKNAQFTVTRGNYSYTAASNDC